MGISVLPYLLTSNECNSSITIVKHLQNVDSLVSSSKLLQVNSKLLQKHFQNARSLVSSSVIEAASHRRSITDMVTFLLDFISSF